MTKPSYTSADRCEGAELGPGAASSMRYPCPDGPSFLATNLDCVADRRLRL